MQFNLINNSNLQNAIPLINPSNGTQASPSKPEDERIISISTDALAKEPIANNSTTNPLKERVTAIGKPEESPIVPKKMSIDKLVLSITKKRLDNCYAKTEKEFSEIKDRQKKISNLHKLHKTLNAHTTSKGEIDFKNNEELKSLIKNAKDQGLEIDPTKTVYNKDERERLVDNIRMSVEDLNLQNDLQLQTVTRLTNEDMRHTKWPGLS